MSLTPSPHLLCPYCTELMHAIVQAGVVVDYCSRCRGVWFDAAELDQMLSIRIEPKRPPKKPWRRGQPIDLTEEPIDVRTLNTLRGVPCPRCPATLIERALDKRSGVYVDACPVCYGLFVKAGMLTRLPPLPEPVPESGPH